MNERSKRTKLNENTAIVVPQNLSANDLNNNSSPKRKRSEPVEPAKGALKKNRKEHSKTLKQLKS